MRAKKPYQEKAERLERLMLNFTKWLDKNYETITINEIKVYWKKAIENYVFENVAKVIEALDESKEERIDGRKT